MKFDLKNIVLMVTFSLLLTTVLHTNPILISGINIQKIDNSKSFRLRLGAMPTGKVELHFKDAQGKTLYTEDVSGKEDYSKLFELEDLPLGNYFLSVEDVTSITVQPIVICSDNLTLDGTKRQKFFKPHFEMRNDKLVLTLLSKKPTKAKVKAENSAGRLLWKEKVTVADKFEKGYNFGQFGPNNYTLTIEIDGFIYKKEIKIR